MKDKFEGERYLRERWLRDDLAIIKAWKSDPVGNLIYRKTARTFNPMMATVAKVTVVEVEEVVERGALDPDAIHTSFLDSAASLAMIRGSRIDLAMLGAMEVPDRRHCVPYHPGQDGEGHGGAMDQVAGVKRVIVILDHANKAGRSKVLKRCTLPLTGKACVDMIITDLCVFDIDRAGGGRAVRKLAPSVDLDLVRSRTEAEYEVALS